MEWQWIIAGGSLLLLLGVGIFECIRNGKERRQMRALEEMLDAAISGEFLEKNYDETCCSAIESRMAQYLKKCEGVQKKQKDNQEKTNRLISDISHQTKTPLTNISLYTELLLEKELADETRNYVFQIHSQAEKLQFLLNTLIRSSRLETGIIRLYSKKQEVCEMIENAVAQIRSKAEKREIEIVICEECEEESSKNRMAGQAVFDEKWTQEALYNILDNAVKYTHPGDRIEVHRTDYELFLRIDVTDHGIGISEKESGRIFGRFFRGEQVRNQEGVGIGLYLANQIVSGEGGYLKVKSVPGEFTTFSIFLSKSE